MEAWQKLIRVLTHEIMNSITPIISLAETLSERSRENPHDERTRTHIQKGLEVIHRRSKGLLEFVENYRKLTRIAPPVRNRSRFRPSSTTCGGSTLLPSFTSQHLPASPSWPTGLRWNKSSSTC